MCPDKAILSAYLDGEIPAPWNEKIHRHLAECPGCAAQYAKLQGLSLALRSGQEEISARQLSDSQEKVYTALMARREDREYYRSRHFWTRRINVSFPILAAAALVCLFLGAGFVGLFSNFTPGGTAAPGMMTATETLPSDNNSIRLIGNNLDDLADFLRQRDENVQIFIELPPAPIFDGTAQEPQLIRAADYQNPAGNRR